MILCIPRSMKASRFISSRPDLNQKILQRYYCYKMEKPKIKQIGFTQFGNKIIMFIVMEDGRLLRREEDLETNEVAVTEINL